MNELLKALYDSFYERPSATNLKAEIERCHQALIEKLDKPERRVVLQIIDCKDQIAEDLLPNGPARRFEKLSRKVHLNARPSIAFSVLIMYNYYSYEIVQTKRISRSFWREHEGVLSFKLIATEGVPLCSTGTT